MFLNVKYLPVILIFFISACTVGVTTDEEVNKSRPAHHTDGGFRNLYIEDIRGDFFGFLKARLSDDIEWADHETYADQISWQKLNLDKEAQDMWE